MMHSTNAQDNMNIPISERQWQRKTNKKCPQETMALVVCVCAHAYIHILEIVTIALEVPE